MIAYCPLDLPRILIDQALLNTLFSKHATEHHDGLWKCLPLLGRVSSQHDFCNPAAFESAWEKRYSLTGEVSLNQAIYELLKPLYDHMLTLPLIVTHAQILCQIKDVGKHYDLKHEGTVFFDDYPGVNNRAEPAGYKILLNNFDKKSFYVSSTFGKPNIYIELPDTTNTFVINEKNHPHGSTLLENPKYIVSLFGLIDETEHAKLIQKSIEKYSSFVISFE